MRKPNLVRQDGSARKRLESNPLAVDRIARKALRSSQGRLTNYEVCRIVRADGWGCNGKTIAAIRADMGLPNTKGGPWSKGNPGKRVFAKSGPRKLISRTPAPEAPMAIPSPVKHEPAVRDWSPITGPERLSTAYLRRCVVEWNRRVRNATELLDLATDPLKPLDEVPGAIKADQP